MPRRCFYSFDYKTDNWRVSTVKGIGAVEGQPVVSGNEWEQVERGGDSAIQRWIDEQMKGRSCLIVLIGSGTAGRRWVNYEIKKAWDDGKGVLGVHIHNLLDRNGRASIKGANPFVSFTVGQRPLTTWVKTYDPPYSDSKMVYNYIAENIEKWIEAAIQARNSV